MKGSLPRLLNILLRVLHTDAVDVGGKKKKVGGGCWTSPGRTVGSEEAFYRLEHAAFHDAWPRPILRSAVEPSVQDLFHQLFAVPVLHIPFAYVCTVPVTIHTIG